MIGATRWYLFIGSVPIAAALIWWAAGPWVAIGGVLGLLVVWRAGFDEGVEVGKREARPPDEPASAVGSVSPLLGRVREPDSKRVGRP